MREDVREFLRTLIVFVVLGSVLAVVLYSAQVTLIAKTSKSLLIPTLLLWALVIIGTAWVLERMLRYYASLSESSSGSVDRSAVQDQRLESDFPDLGRALPGQ